MTQTADLMGDLLDAILKGWGTFVLVESSASHQATSAASACFIECWFYILAKVSHEAIQGTTGKA